MSNATNLVKKIETSHSGMNKAACIEMGNLLKGNGYSGRISRDTQGHWSLIVKGCKAKGGAVDVQTITKPSHLLGYV